MRVLMVAPPKTLWVSRQMKMYKGIDEELGSYLPLGLLYVASYLKKNSEHDVEIIDCPTEGMDHAGLENEFARRKPDIVGIYVCTEYLYDAFAAAGAVHRAHPGTIVVAGGPHVFEYPKETIVHPAIDYVVYGEGEVIFTRMVDALARGAEPDGIEGVVSKRSQDAPRKLQKIDDLDTLPHPDRRLIDVQKYRSFITHDNPVTTMMTSRGCAFNCYYCSNLERAQKVRMRGAQNVVEEIEDVVKQGIHDIIFFDENFTFNRARVEEICDEIIRRKLKVRWHCRSRADMSLDPAMLRKMRRAGCRMIQFGIDGGTPRMQQLINKKLDLEKVRKVIAMTRGAGILTYGNFIIGLPTETREEMLATIEYAVSLNLDYAPFSVFNPLPGSVFYEQGLKSGVIPGDRWLDFVKDPEKPIADYWWPEQDKDKLYAMDDFAFRRFYLRPAYLLKALLRRQSLPQKLWQVKSALKLFVFNK